MSTFTLHHSAPAVNTEASIAARAQELFEERYAVVARHADRLFGVLLVLQWVAAVVAAAWLSPYAWSGRAQSVHLHVYAALVLGGAISSLPLALIVMRPGQASTRYVVAVAQMLWSALLIHLTGGRIETHFHVFGSLAFLAFYRDMRLLVVASVIVTIDHFARGVVWPESVYGVVNPEWWRFLEHTGWVLFIDVFIAMNTRHGLRDMRGLVERQARIEAFQREQLARVERLAEIGQLAASIGHELRNPLAAIRNAHAYIERRLDASSPADGKVPQFMGLIDRELSACSRIIGNLLDFARSRELQLARCPLRPLVEEAMGLVVVPAGVRVINTVADDAPIPELDKDQFRQVLVNLVQNAVEAVPSGGVGEVLIRCSAGDGVALSLEVSDNGAGIAPDALERIFEPLYSTKTKGTGLGLAVVAGIIARHGGRLRVSSELGLGSTFSIELPLATPAIAAQGAA